jgi:hypothetical protein
MHINKGLKGLSKVSIFFLLLLHLLYTQHLHLTVVLNSTLCTGKCVLADGYVDATYVLQVSQIVVDYSDHWKYVYCIVCGT